LITDTINAGGNLDACPPDRLRVNIPSELQVREVRDLWVGLNSSERPSGGANARADCCGTRKRIDDQAGRHVADGLGYRTGSETSRVPEPAVERLPPRAVRRPGIGSCYHRGDDISTAVTLCANRA
jgi:hypothetical protein